jgi:hypothetical protein
MGVDHYAFVAYGTKASLKDGASLDDLDEWLSKTGSDLDLGYTQWGSRNYGGDGGIVIGDRRFVKCYDFDDGGDLGSFSSDNPPTDTSSRVRAAVKRGAPITIDGDGTRWWFGGHTC